jgi:exonuclease SbcC
MITSIRLTNWRSHANTKLEFRAGTNLLIGIMGSGKSSVLEAVSFALFGTFPALERRKLKIEDIIRLTEPESKVSLGFGWDGKSYRVERTIQRKKKGTSTNAEVFKDNALVESGTTSATSYIENLTSLDYDLFTRAIYSEQNHIDYFLTLDPRRRKQEIDTLLGLDRFETARSNAVTVANRIRSKRQGMEERFSEEKVTQLEQEEKRHKEEVLSSESSLKETSGILEKHQEDLKGLAGRYDAMRKDKEAHDTMKEESLRLSGQQDSLKKELAAKAYDEKAYAEGKGRLAALSEEKKQLTDSASATEDKSGRLSKEAGQLEAKLSAASKAKGQGESLAKSLAELLGGKSAEELNDSLAGTEKEILSMESEAKSSEKGISDATELLGKLEPGLSECPLCSSKLTGDGITHVREEKEALINKGKERIAELSSAIKASKAKHQELKEKVRKSALLGEQLKSLEEQSKGMEAMSSRKAEVQAGLEEASKEKREAQNALDRAAKESEKLRLELSEQESLLKKKGELEQVDKRLALLKDKLGALKFDEGSYEKLRLETEQARLRNERILSQRKSLEEKLRMGKELLKRISDELTGIRGMAEEIKHLAVLEEQLNIYKNALLETQTNLRGILTDAINSAMNEIWPIFYPYRNYHALRLAVSEKDYVFEVDDGRDWKALESMASGGERATAALTLRVALAMVLTPTLSWLILDEPTHNLDTEAVGLLSHALQFKVPEVVKQTFVITHEEGLMGSDFASSYRLSRDKQHNGETKVELA